MTIASLVTAARGMKQGDAGENVRQLQMALAEVGFPLKGSGWFGPATDTAVVEFQRRVGLEDDGEVGPQTAAKLDMAVAAKTKGGVDVIPTVKAEIGSPLWLQYSVAHIGLREGPGSIDNKQLVADIRTVASDYQHDATPWCAGWVSLCLAKAGVKPSGQPLWALSYSSGWGIKLPGPALGAIAVKTRNGGGHVTFVAGRNRNGVLACCGGNQNDMVNISEYRADVFKGFYWPKEVPLPAKIGISLLPIVNSAGKVTSEA